MKKFACLLVLATFAVVAPGYGQSATDQAVNELGTIRRPTPKPGTGATATATGPMDATLYKDDKAKNATTTFTPTETVYLVCKNVSGKKGDKIGVAWYSGAGGKSKKLYASEKPLPDTGVYNPSYNLPPAKGGTPAGAYHVDFTLDSKVLKSLAFTVK